MNKTIRRTAFAALTLATMAGFATTTPAQAASVNPGDTISVGNAPFDSVGSKCDSEFNGWHFILNQLEYPQGATIDASDFGTVDFTLLGDATVYHAPFSFLAGDNTAHFINTTDQQSGNFTIVSATMTFPAGTDVTGYGQFRISHVPCGTVETTTTTTTQPPTTTTVAETTTTVAETTTTAATTTTEAPTTTAAVTTTTEEVSSQGPVPSVDVCLNIDGDQVTVPDGLVQDGAGNCIEPAAPGGALPVTGGSTLGAALIGGGLLAAGAIALRISRRRSASI